MMDNPRLRLAALCLLAATAGSCGVETRWEEFPAQDLDRLVVQGFAPEKPELDAPPCFDVAAPDSGGAAAHFFVNVEVNGLPASMLIDTGASRTLLFPELASRAKLRLAPVRAEARLLDENVPFNLGELRELRLGPLSMKNFPVFVARKQLIRALCPMDGMLGLDFLRRFSLTLDYERRTALFRRESRPIPPGARSAPVEIRKSWGPFGLHGWIPQMECRLGESGPYPCIFDSGASSSIVFVPQEIWKRAGSDRGIRLRIGDIELDQVPAQPWNGDAVQFGPAVLIAAGWTRVTLDSLAGTFAVEKD
jgi:predicted aspartyl protease